MAVTTKQKEKVKQMTKKNNPIDMFINAYSPDTMKDLGDKLKDFLNVKRVDRAKSDKLFSEHVEKKIREKFKAYKDIPYGKRDNKLNQYVRVYRGYFAECIVNVGSAKPNSTGKKKATGNKITVDISADGYVNNILALIYKAEEKNTIQDVLEITQCLFAKYHLTIKDKKIVVG